MRVFKIDNNIETRVVDLRRSKILTKNNKMTGLARLGKTLCLKVKGNDCGKRRGKHRREKRDQEEDQDGIHDSNRNNQEVDSAEEVDKRRKKRRKGRSSHQMVFEFTFYTDPVLNVEMVVEHKV
jgi:hypothetical protein